MFKVKCACYVEIGFSRRKESIPKIYARHWRPWQRTGPIRFLPHDEESASTQPGIESSPSSDDGSCVSQTTLRGCWLEASDRILLLLG